MIPENLLVLGVLLVAVVLFATERWRVDFVALAVMISLIILGVVTPQEAVAGFVNPATVTIAAMFVLSAGLHYTGALNSLGEHIVRLAGSSEQRMLLVLMPTVALLSAFVLNTAVVAVFIPVTLKVAGDAGIAPSRLLMPVSFAAILGGTLTLIGTSTNLLVAGIAQQAGVRTFTMFDFTPLGAIVLVTGFAYMLIAGKRLIPERHTEASLLDKYGVREYLSEVVVLADSPLVGRRLADADLTNRLDITVLDILRDGRSIHLPGASRHLRPGDVILVRAPLERILAVQKDQGLELSPAHKLAPELLNKEDDDVAMAEVIVAPRSSLIGHSLKELNFRQHYGAIVIGMQRRGVPLYGKLGHESIMTGDMLLLLGRREALENLRQSHDFLLLLDVALPPQRKRAHWAVIILLAVVLVTLLGILPVMAAALVGAFAIVFTGVLTLDEAYAALDKRVLVMLGAILSLQAAMENSGLAADIAVRAVGFLGAAPPWMLIGVFYLLTSVLTETMSNSATAVILTPLAISMAGTLGADSFPFLMAIAFAASASFMTPVGYQTNTMVYGAGGYRFFDFTRVGTPLNLLLWVVCSLAIPVLWPLY